MTERRPEHVAAVGVHRGAPALFVDGTPRPFTSFKLTETPNLAAALDAADAEIPGLARRGVGIVWVPVFVGWSGPDRYDFSDMDARVERVLRLLDGSTPPGEPRGAVVIRLQAAIFHPAWYVDRARGADGRPTNLVEFRTPEGPANGRVANPATVAISLGDPFWETFAVDCLRACVRHVRESRWADRVIGWLPCAFNSNEWLLRCDCPDSTHDFSRPTQEAFARHLRDIRGIDAADPVPPPDACLDAYRGEFVATDPLKGPFVAEYATWSSDRIAGIILAWARAVREECEPFRKLVGFFYGYGTELSGTPQYAQCGHLALERLLASDDVDFICSPCQYGYRADQGAVTHGSVLGAFADAAGVRGKLAFAEDDHRPPKVRTANHCLATRDRWHDEMFFRRNFVETMTHGRQQWWYSLGPRWMDEEWRQEIAGRLHRLGVEAMDRDRSPAAEVAVVFDERSPAAMRLNRDLQRSLMLKTHAESFLPAGAPVDLLELRTFLFHTDPAPYRFVAFLNLFAADGAVRAAVDRLKGGGRTLFFQYAPGFGMDGPEGRRFSAGFSSDLVGMRLVEEGDPAPLIVWIDPDSHPFFAECADMRYGYGNYDLPVAPVLAADDPDAEELGRLYGGRPGLAAKRRPDWTAVFSAAPEIPAAAVRRLLRRAGVHLYGEEGDVVCADRSWVGYTACSRGAKRLVLPAPRRVADALTGEPLALDAANSASFFMRRHEVRIFRLD